MAEQHKQEDEKFVGWVIIYDHLAEKYTDGDEVDNVGLGQTQEDHEKRTFFTHQTSKPLPLDGVKNPVQFRLYDDDGELYYSGEISKEALDDDDFSAGPFTWGMNDSGATEMQILREDEKWVSFIS